MSQTNEQLVASIAGRFIASAMAAQNIRHPSRSVTPGERIEIDNHYRAAVREAQRIVVLAVSPEERADLDPLAFPHALDLIPKREPGDERAIDRQVKDLVV